MSTTNTIAWHPKPTIGSAPPGRPLQPNPPHSHRSSRGLTARRQSGVRCPNCGLSMTPESGCWLCYDCGCSYCG